MRLDHGEAELEAGQSYVMTLKDQNVLDYDNSDEDDQNQNGEGEIVLESTHLQSEFRRKVKDQKKA